MGQKKRFVRFPNNSGSGNDDLFQFFGFKSTSSSKTISNISILTYDPEELYASRYKADELQESMEIMKDSISAKLNVHGLLVNRQLMGLEKAQPTSETNEFTEVHTNIEWDANVGMVVALVFGLVFLIGLTILSIRHMSSKGSQ